VPPAAAAPPAPKAPPAPPAPCLIQQNWPPYPQMPVGGDNPRHGDGGSRGSSTQHGGIVQDTMGNLFQPIVVWHPDFGETRNWHPDSPCLGGGLPTQVQGYDCTPAGFLSNGTSWYPAALWNGSGNLVAHGWEQHVADDLPYSL
jgi:hypothetical protein